MLFLSPMRRAVAAFFLLLFFAVVASAVCVAFGAAAVPSFAPVAADSPRIEAPARRVAEESVVPLAGRASAAMQLPGSAPRAGVGT